MEGQGKAGGERGLWCFCVRHLSKVVLGPVSHVCLEGLDHRIPLPPAEVMKERERDPVMVNLKGLLSRACILGRDHSMEPPFFHLSHWFHQQAQMM